MRKNTFLVNVDWFFLSHRLPIALKILELWQQSPLLGAGLGVFIAKSVAWLGHPQVIHSTPLWILAELGVIGAIIFGI